MYSVNTAVKYNTSHPVENPEPVKNLPIYRIYLRSAQITTDWFSQITFPIELHDVHLLPHGSKYQIAVESLICETSGAHNRIVVLHCDDIRTFASCESTTGGVRSGSSVLAQTSVGNGSGGFSQLITKDSVGIHCDINTFIHKKSITLQLKNYNDAVFTDGALGTNHGDWAVSLIIYPVN